MITNPFYLQCMKILDDLKSSIITYVNRYFAGNSTTGALSELQEYIGSQAGSVANVIKTGFVDIAAATDMRGSPSVYESSAASLTIAPETLVRSIMVAGNSSTKPTATLNGVNIPFDYRQWSLGIDNYWTGEMTLSGKITGGAALVLTNTAQTCIIFDQDQSSTTPGVF